MLKNSNHLPLNRFYELLMRFEHNLELFFRGVIYPGSCIFFDDIADEIFLFPWLEDIFIFISKSFVKINNSAQKNKRKFINLYHSSLREFGVLFKALLIIIFLPFLLSLIYSISLLFIEDKPYNIGFDKEILSVFFGKYFYAFSWYGSWLGILYNLTAVLGVSFAVMTYYKNNQSQAAINHFSNVQLFREYVQTEISKYNRLSPASFDLMAWYSCIYPLSKNGVLVCSRGYINLVSEYDSLINSSNFSVRENGKDGFKHMPHQAQANRILSEFGIFIKETNRLGYHEVEGEVIALIEKINGAFPTDVKFKKFRKRSYL